MIKFVAQITCDAQNCNSIISTNAWEKFDAASCQVIVRANYKDWVFIDHEHYCPKCAEVLQGGNNLSWVYVYKDTPDLKTV